MPLMSNFNVNGHDYEIKDAAARGDISTLQTSKENVANKVTSISNTSTDTEYPSAKAVYTAVTNADRWEEVTYATSTAAEIAAILARDHIPYFIYSDRIYLYAATTPTAYFFQTMVITSSSPYLVGATCLIATSAWSITQFTESTAISASSTNMQLAGAKAVYDFVTASASKIYAHKVHIEDDGSDPDTDYSMDFVITSSSSTAITTIAGLAAYDGLVYAAEVSYDDNFLGQSVIGYTLHYDNGNTRIYINGYNTVTSQVVVVPIGIANAVITDTVVQL